MIIDKFPAGVPFEVGRVIGRALREEPEFLDALLLDNPVRASELNEGERIVFFEEQRDVLVGQPGQVQDRIYHFSVGVISRATDSRRQAHGDYRLAKRVLRNRVMQMLSSEGLRLSGSGLLEGDVHYRLENIDVGGSLVLGQFSVQYRDPS